ncbi:hypothetical protein [Sedimenticola hydrogenitrophicus]|uniref:hypothetical protein n=1 Tax=Sedimenticola hydrogenitrophicus TaxID=2967975 RepID=UPI0023AE7186|nr:hypothetical protein [Sedimenticola hydrogenitrophicus]
MSTLASQATGDSITDSRIEYDAWNPGISSQLPREVLVFSTILRPENVFQTFSEIEELSHFTGLLMEEIATLRPERLVVHELLIRLSANYQISDGEQYEDLGVNFRRMAQTLLDKYLQPKMQDAVDCYDALQQRVYEKVDQELEATLFKKPVAVIEEKGWWKRLTRRREKKSSIKAPEILEAETLEQWRQRASQATDDNALERAIYHRLHHVCGAILCKHGRVRGEKELLARLVTQQVCNSHGSNLIGSLISPFIDAGALAEGYSRLPTQPQPVVMNIKGAAASGKSTLRPLQQQLTHSLGLSWGDFALISPDIWRKFLLDYESLDEFYKYAATCTGHELQIVDQKLDAYISEKAKRHAVPHLLIDRFRFDSFAKESREAGSNLLTRFGAKIYMFYMITPPHATVERAWSRGIKVGRYKAVDDLLYHNIEAFTGMPELFFTWALDQVKDVHYEFLDNSVKLGERPRTVAFGMNGSLNILDINCLMDIDRYRKININATSADTVYPPASAMAPEENTDFIRDCIKRLSEINLVDAGSGEIIAQIEQSQLVGLNPKALEGAIPDRDTRTALLQLFPSSQNAQTISAPATVDVALQHTLGEWGR